MKTDDAQLAKRETALAAQPEISVSHMLQTVLERGITEQNVAAFEKLIALHERMEDRRAEQQFNEAFVRLQADMGPVQAMRAVPDNSGGVRYMFAPFEDIVRQAKPALQANGFTITFSMEVAESRITQHCTLAHTGGHKRTNSFTARIGKGPPGSTDTQADGAASTYAKRFALCDCLAIVVERDTDARSEGAPITQAQADSLRARLESIHGSVKDFLDYAGAKAFEDIGADKYGMLDDALRRKEAKGR